MSAPAETKGSQPLQPLHFPLWGSRLIEASAGTGKTWTIAALYLRLVLGHGAGHGFSKPLMPPDILVMTFTRAATRELSDRIRARLIHLVDKEKDRDLIPREQPPQGFHMTLHAVRTADQKNRIVHDL